MQNIGAILIAHQNPQRALLPMGGDVLLSRMVKTCLAAGADTVLVTVPAEHPAVAAVLESLPVTILSVSCDTEMFSALCQTLDQCPEKIDRIFVSPVSIPPFSSALLEQMLSCPLPVCRPERGGIGVHPVLLSREAMDRVAAYRGEDGLRGALRIFPEREVCRLSLDEQHAFGIHPDVQVRIADDSPFFGPGPRQLLLGIRARGSVAHACAAVGLSYSKGRALLRRMEQALGIPLVTRTQGGTGGGSASLTPEGEQFLSRYACYEQAVADYAAAVFSDYFPHEPAPTRTETEEHQA